MIIIEILVSVMSQATKRKHVRLEMLQVDLTNPGESQQIVKILKSRGNNLHEVEAPDKSVFLVSMPSKFRRNIWVKRGDYVLVEPIAEGDKVKAEIVRILTNEHIKHFKKENVWPVEFQDEQNSSGDDLFVNTNRQHFSDNESESSETEESEEEISNQEMKNK